MSEYTDIAFVVEGGIGKNIEATAVIRAMKKTLGKEITVLCSFPEIFTTNPNVDKLYHLSNPLHFFKDYLLKKKTRVIRVEPYMDNEYYYDKLHFTKTWCKLAGIEDDGIRPELFLTETEIEEAISILKERKVEPNKLVLFQWQGGIVPQANTQDAQNDAKRKMFRRSLPMHTAQEIADKLKEKGYTVWSIQHPNQAQLKGVEVPIMGFDAQKRPIPMSIRRIIAILSLCKSFIAIDSFLQHASASVDKKGVVLWGATDFRNDGYEHNINMEIKEPCSTPHCHRPYNQFFDNNFECSAGEKCMRFIADDVVGAFETLTKEK